jgi:membrane-associated protease RseP (regulator of RpoE activity)
MEYPMRKRTIIFTLIAAVAGATEVVAAAPDDQKQSDSATSPDMDDVHVTVTAGRGRLGFAALQISPELRKFLGAPADRGVLVNAVRPDSPAARAGLRVGDVLLDVGSEAVRSAEDVIDAISDRKKGDVVTLQIERGKEHLTLQPKLEDDPGPRLGRIDRFGDDVWEQFGRFGDKDTRRAVDQMRKEMQELEHRLEKLEKPPTPRARG